MRILVTGGAGFIGSHIVDYHLKQGDSVMAIDDLSSGRFDNLKHWEKNSQFNFIHTDILKSDIIEKNIASFDRIYNMGAIVGMQKVLHNPLLTLDVNIKILEKILIAATPLEKRPTIIVASSSEVYGRQSGALKEKQPLTLETTLKGHANYPVSKLCNEVMAESYYKEFGVPTIIIRIFNTIGPRQSGYYGMVVPRFVEEAIHHKPLTVNGNGSSTRAFCDVRDLVRLLGNLAGNSKALGQVINIGRDHATSILELAELVKAQAKSNSKIEFIPIEKAYGADYIEIPHRCPNLNYLKEFIKVHFEWPLERTIQDLIELKTPR